MTESGFRCESKSYCGFTASHLVSNTVVVSKTTSYPSLVLASMKNLLAILLETVQQRVKLICVVLGTTSVVICKIGLCRVVAGLCC